VSLQKQTPFTMKKIYFYIFSTISIATCFGQNMQKGFNFLENGKYKQATVFFTEILKQFPNNKTANLCFGRAVGLNGDSAKAKEIFTNLSQQYPNDFEIALNFAEALLWNKEFAVAENYYKKLVSQKSDNFPALLGYANTLSNLKKYTEALSYVNKALQVSYNNPNALISKKYMHLGLANQQLNNQEYTQAIETLEKNFNIFPNDTDTYLNLANTYLISKNYAKAKGIYHKMAQKENLFFTAQNGLALVYHLEEQNKKALEISQNTLNQISKTTSNIDVQNTQTRYVQSLIWNKKYNLATKHITTLTPQNSVWVNSLKATIATYMGDFKYSIKMYDSILAEKPQSFDGNLGKANALKARNELKKAYILGQKALSFYPKQKDISKFVKQIKTQLTPTFDSKLAYSVDNGKSESYYANQQINLPITTKTSIKALYHYQNATNTISNSDVTTHKVGLGLSHQVKPNLNLTTVLGVNKVNGNNQLTADINLKIKPYKRQNLTLGYKRELQSFNADLLNKNIIQNHFYANYNINTLFNLGWFTQAYHTLQSDNNSRNLLFTSLYYNLLNNPLIKTGINYQYLGFKNQVPTVYFSPKKFNAAEVFVTILKDKNQVKDQSFFYELTAAYGYQFVEDEDRKSAYRVQGNIGYKFNRRCFLEGYFLRSNIAAVATNVFTYNEVGVKLKWLITKKPIFKIN